MSSNHSSDNSRGTLTVLMYLCEAARGALKLGTLERAEEFLAEASREHEQLAEYACGLREAAERAERAAVAARVEADRFDTLTRRIGRRIERLAMVGLRRQLASSPSHVRELGGLFPLMLAALVILSACAADAGAGDVPTVHFPLATYADVAGAELGALQGALSTLNAACVPVGSESNTAPTPLFWAHYATPIPADTCTAVVVRAGDVAGAGAELVDRAGCLPALLVHPGASAADVAAELAEFTAGRAELVCSL